jgi:hypothetical protein
MFPRQLWPLLQSAAAWVHGSIGWYPPPCVRPASDTCVAHKDKDVPGRWVADVHYHGHKSKRRGCSVLLPEGIEAVRPSLFALWTSLLLATKKPHAARARE